MKAFIKQPTQEEWFLMWAEEAKVNGFISSIILGTDTEPYPLTEPVTLFYNKEVVKYKGTKREKVDRIVKQNTILNGSSYRPDFVIRWTDKARGVLFSSIHHDVNDIVDKKTYFIANEASDGSFYSVLDVKSPFRGKNSSDVSFSLNRKLVWVKYHVFVNKVINYPTKKMKHPKGYLWVDTFTPTRFFFTDKKLDRKIISNFNAITMNDFRLLYTL